MLTRSVFGKLAKATLFCLVFLFPYLTSRLLNKLPDTGLMMDFIGSALSTTVVIFEVVFISHFYDQFTTKKGLNSEQQQTEL